MRCPQCGNDCAQGAQFCSRCGSRLFAPKLDAVREYTLDKWYTSWWKDSPPLITGCIAIIVGAGLVVTGLVSTPPEWTIGLLVMAAGAIVAMSAITRHNARNWTLTSDRVIAQDGVFSTIRREIELADIRAVEISQRYAQRGMHIGDITISSAASADSIIRMTDVRDPNAVADTVRRARLKRLA